MRRGDVLFYKSIIEKCTALGYDGFEIFMSDNLSRSLKEISVMLCVDYGRFQRFYRRFIKEIQRARHEHEQSGNTE